ncbi:hypothetical protein [Planktothricoides raciborskii]|uniref:Uncharacterized protein n=1 Tax=Planktothricoides raciborskii FACHB-1370 TaxID=2949576 RepID=A0ABR8EM52_9CYAN|nr:hypothetical protein [Planktothricoides raciborskii]MBD2547976.1 hypothetical protein [Planktothricoides raciborskii FACHB-1370]MBD2586367.1 hypothetical protein [Planktothricoides raciborskii FACHB-1261]
MNSSTYSPCSFERSASARFRYLLFERVQVGQKASRLTLANWLEGIPILAMSYLFFSPLHAFDGESPGGADA